MNLTPLHAWHVSHQARMEDFAGWHMPIQYSSITQEHQAVRQRVGLFDISHMGRIEFTGPDAERFLDYLLTNDVTRLTLGQVRYSLICNPQGGILDDVLVYRFTDRWMLVVNASNRQKILNWAADHQAGYDVVVDDQTCNTGMIAVQGPLAAALLQADFPATLPQMDYYTVVETSFKRERCLVSRTGYTGEDGYEIIIPAALTADYWQDLLNRGERDGIVPCGLGCRDTLRLEAGMPLYGHELDENTNPLMAGLGFGVRLRASDFIGREALLAVKQKGVDSIRVGLVLEGKRIARQGAPVLLNDQAIGHVTSGTYSPTLDKSIAMAYVNLSACAPGQAVQVDIRGKQNPAETVKLPFYSRD